MNEQQQELFKELKIIRGQIKGKLTRFQTYLENTFVKSPSITELAKRLEKVELTWEEFDSCQLEIEKVDQTQEHYNEREAFENMFFQLISRAQEIINTSKQSQMCTNTKVDDIASGTGNQTVVSHQVNLPKLNLPRFGGSYNEYMNFHDIFETLINKNLTLSNVQKFHYLKSCLHGDSLKVVQSLEITDSNYQIALDLLKERYENKRVIINSHLRSLFELPIVPKENSRALRHFLDSYLKDFRSLKNMEQPVEQWDTILLYLLVSKLDFSTRREWETAVKPGVLPTLEDFNKFLNCRCQVLETLYTRSNTISEYTKPYVSVSAQKFSDSRLSTHLSIGKDAKCFYCKGYHFLFYCKEFLKLAVEDRYNEVKRLNLCINCLRPFSHNHRCSGTCKICRSTKHNSLLHISRKFTQSNINSEQSHRKTDVSFDNFGTEGTQNENVNNINVSAHCNHNNNSMILLATACIYIENCKHELIECRCLLDSGSQSNFITSELVQRLGLRVSAINFPITGISETLTNITQRVTSKITSMHSNFSRELSFLVLNNITGYIPCQSFDTSALSIPDGIFLADQKYNVSRKIDILLGASIFYELLTVGKINLGRNKPILQNSKLGWLVTGPIFVSNMQKESRLCLFSKEEQNIQIQLEKFWTLEDMPFTSKNVKFTKDEQFCENHFSKTHTRDSTGRFVVALPLKENYLSIGDSFHSAKNRFLKIEQKIQTDKNYGDMYKKFMREYVSLGHMSKLDKSKISTDSIKYYLPHHGVFKASSVTTKLRVVFDASAKSSTGISLNDVSYIGPRIQDELWSILLRFRLHNYVLKGDITKMYRQVNVREDQRNLQRILWRENPNQDICHYMLNTVTYGTASAAFLAIRSMQQAALDQKEFFPKACKTILSDFYVDDLITGDNSIENLKKLKSDIFEVLKTAGFILTQFMSNSAEILESDIKQDNFHISDSDKTVKTLGILWNPNSDAFQFAINFKIPNQNITKRSILSIISQIFDPLGIIGPIVIRAKVILQHLWKLKLEWDEVIPPSHQEQFFKFFSELKFLDKISVPRQVLPSTFVKLQLHGFTDSSETAYGVCIYLRTTDSYGKHYASLLCSKSRVAPLKAVSLPRLELCGAVLLARLITKVCSSLKLNISGTYLWTDSQIVLAWLSQEPTVWKTFICNRVSEIQTLSKIDDWHHISSTDNPADVISRGCSTNNLIESNIWWSGPDWLIQNSELWPTQKIFNKNHDIPEKRMVDRIVCISIDNNFNLFDRFSTLQRLRNVTAFCLRFVVNLHLKQAGKAIMTHNLTIKEVNKADKILIKIVQETVFFRELHDLRLSRQVNKNSKLANLNPFLDDQGIIRVGGRLGNSKVSYDHKHPIVLPGKHKFTDLIIIHEHERTLHGGTQLVLSSIRTTFWPINVKNSIKRIIRGCITCFKSKPNSFAPMMGQLPESRVTPSRPFSSCGVDFAGPFLIKDGTLRCRKLVKAYICVFICFSTKAIHLELVGDLSTPAFLNTLKRFFARRGISKNIWSDNGSNFVGASNQISKLYKMIKRLYDDKFIQYYLLENKVTWHFIPPRSPHFGGLWESAVKLVKHHLIRSIGLSHLTYENFLTIITQIESILNSRPICPLSEDPNDLDPLTPGHFLIGAKLTALPEENVEDVPSNRLNKYRQIQQITQVFWRRWSRDYLHNLQQRNKWKFNDASIMKPGLMVLLREDNVSPLNWKLGRIIKVHPGKDNIARVASIKTSSGEVQRAFTKICLLPVEV